MPIIEGQAIGRPVVTSNLSPMREIAGEAAVLVNPNDVSSIRDGFVKAKENYDSLVSRGLENVKKYRIEAVANKYLQSYNSLLGKK
jgi:glycosyltransferase involved in cell wall biosynthesis